MKAVSVESAAARGAGASIDTDRSTSGPVLATRWTQPLESLAMTAGFVLVLVAQWMPWFHVRMPSGFDASPDVASVSAMLGHGSIDFIDAAGILSIPYYLGWFGVFAAVAATVLGSPRVRRACAPIGLGVLGAEALLVFAVTHTRGLSSADAWDLPSGVSIHRASGVYVCVAAIVLFGLALLPTLVASGAVPSVTSIRAAAGHLLGRPMRAESMSDSDPVRSGREVQTHISPVAPAPAIMPVDGVVATGGNDTSDHSLYRRPIETTRR